MAHLDLADNTFNFCIHRKFIEIKKNELFDKGFEDWLF